jgi:hypothetical protein
MPHPGSTTPANESVISTGAGNVGPMAQKKTSAVGSRMKIARRVLFQRRTI